MVFLSIFVYSFFCLFSCYSQTCYPETSKIMIEGIPGVRTQYGPVAPGYIYGDFRTAETGNKGIFVLWGFVLSSDGSKVLFKKHLAGVFRKYSNGLISAFLRQNNGPYWCILDQNFHFRDYFNNRKNILNIDPHDFILLPNGNCILLTFYYRKCNFEERKCIESSFLKEQSINKPLMEARVQEVKPDGKIVFTWDSKDHCNLNDVFNVTALKYLITRRGIDYLHCNSLWVDFDDNILLSIRHLSQIVKIDKKTGKVLWRLGGRRSDFVFIDDSLGGFSCQHCVSRLDNGHILLYDNGHSHQPPHTRIVEYKLDEEKKTATLVWEYSEDRFTPGTGSAQRLKNGNTFIAWGTFSEKNQIVEITPDKKKVLEISFPSQYFPYRAFKFE